MLERTLGHGGLGLDVVVVGERIMVVKDRELVILVAAIGFADVVGLLVKGAGMGELRQGAGDVPASGGGVLLEACAVGTVGFEFGVQGEEADQGVDHDSEEGEYEADGEDVKDRPAGGTGNEEGNVDDQSGQGTKTEGDGQPEFGLNGDAEARSVGNFAARPWT